MARLVRAVSFVVSVAAAPVLLVLTLASAACDYERPLAPERTGPASAPAPLRTAEFIPGHYIVVFRPGVQPRSVAQSLAAGYGGRLQRTYTGALNGMALELSATQAARLARDPSVASIEQDQVVRAEPVSSDLALGSGALFNAIGVQSNAPWGLDRLDDRFLPLRSTYVYAADGRRARAYIIDTGIRFDHADFEGRASLGFDAVTSGGVDCHGQGTHLAALVGGRTYGVAKRITLKSVRVLDCSGNGTIAGVIAGVNWVTANRVLPAVAVMAVSVFHGSAALNLAVSNSIASGVSYAVSIGNTPFDGCGSSPGGVPAALTTAATSISDGFASFSSFGSCVDLLAPGVNILSAGIASTSATFTRNGSGMAAAHVAGVAAHYLDFNPTATPAQVADGLTRNATRGIISSVPVGTPNQMLYSDFLNRNSWELLGFPPAPGRSDLGVSAAGGLVYMIGGDTDAGPTARVDAYNPANNTYSAKAPLPAPRRVMNGAVLMAGRIFVAGGYDAAGALTGSLFSYNPTTNSWTTRVSMPVTGGCGTSGVINSELYVFSGCTGPTAAAAALLHKFNASTNTWTTLPPAPHNHRNAAGGVLNNKFYVVGGSTAGTAATTTATVDVYDPATNSWSTRANMLQLRRGAAAATVNGLLHVLGGRDASNALPYGTEAYNPFTNTWSVKAGLPLPRGNLGAVTIGGLIYALGGRNNSGHQRRNEVYRP